jgi:ABC-type amino acid transport substrate-binding protein
VLQIAWTATASAATLDRVRQTGKLTLGYRTDAPPFSHKDESGNPDGYAVSLCKAVAEKVKSISASRLGRGVGSGEARINLKLCRRARLTWLCGAADTLASRKDVDFSIPIFPVESEHFSVPTLPPD